MGFHRKIGGEKEKGRITRAAGSQRRNSEEGKRRLLFALDGIFMLILLHSFQDLQIQLQVSNSQTKITRWEMLCDI